MIKTIKIENEEYVRKADIKQEWKRVPNGDNSNPYMEVGKDYFICTVTRYYTGRLIWVGEKEITLEDAAWIPSTGRFHEFISGKSWDESEPYVPGTPVIIGRGAIVEMSEKIGGLITTVK